MVIDVAGDERLVAEEPEPRLPRAPRARRRGRGRGRSRRQRLARRLRALGRLAGGLEDLARALEERPCRRRRARSRRPRDRAPPCRGDATRDLVGDLADDERAGHVGVARPTRCRAARCRRRSSRRRGSGRRPCRGRSAACAPCETMKSSAVVPCAGKAARDRGLHALAVSARRRPRGAVAADLARGGAGRARLSIGGLGGDLGRRTPASWRPVFDSAAVVEELAVGVELDASARSRSASENGNDPGRWRCSTPRRAPPGRRARRGSRDGEPVAISSSSPNSSSGCTSNTPSSRQPRRPPSS